MIAVIGFIWVAKELFPWVPLVFDCPLNLSEAAGTALEWFEYLLELLDKFAELGEFA